MSSLAMSPRHSTSPLALAGEILWKFGRKKKKGQGAAGVTQLAVVVSEVVGGRGLHDVDPQAVSRIFPVLVCADSGMGAPLVNGLLQRRFARAIKGIDESRVAPATVLTIEDLETMLARTGEVSLPTMLRAWHESDPEMTTYPWLMIYNRYFRAGNHANSWVREAALAWKAEMLTRLWPKKHAQAGS